MVSFTDALATLLLIVPGFVATGTMTFILGLRKRDWSSSLILSLVFSTLNYAILILISYYLNIKLIDVGDINLEKTATDLSKLIPITYFSIILSFFIGVVSARILQNKWLTSYLDKMVNKSYQSDIWNDFIEKRPGNRITILLKNGDAYVGIFHLASDSQVLDDRAIVIYDVMVLEKPIQASFANTTPRSSTIPGSLLGSGSS